ncbi:MAG TPA: hypothetical protein VGM05_13410 [Planctomycetaceae bacterium]|jgi:hypothetical protein
MPRDEDPFENAPFSTQLRRELARWFQDRAAPLTAPYVGAVRLLYMLDFPGRIHLICHVVRDIYRFLPDILTGDKQNSRPSDLYPSLVNSLAGKHAEFPPLLNDALGSPPTHAQYPIELHRCVEKLVEARGSLKKQRSIGERCAVALFGAGDRPVGTFLPQWVIKAFKDENEFFVDRAHLRTPAAKIPTDGELHEHFENFERVFHSLIGPYFKGKSELDDILQDTNG